MKIIHFVTALLLLSGVNCVCMAQESDNPSMDTTILGQHVIVGTYTREEGHVDGQAKGIYLFERDLENGQLRLQSSVDGIVNPSFIALSPDSRQVFAVSEVGSRGEPAGLIYSYSVSGEDQLHEIMHASTNGKHPCYVSTDSKGQYVFVANYAGGIDMFKNTDGHLVSTDKVYLEGSSDHIRQDASHPHMAKLSPDDKFLYVTDLGANKIWIFEIDYGNGKLVANTFQPFVDLQPYAGPRHLTFNPVSGDAYVISELDNTVNVYDRNIARGELSFKQTISTLPEGYSGESYCADIHVHPNGKFLYGSNRGHNTIAVFAVDKTHGWLTLLDHTSTNGEYPRNFAIDAEGNYMYVANQNSHSIVQFQIDQYSGRILYKSEIAVKSPVCIVFRN